MAHYELPPLGTEAKMRHKGQDHRATIVQHPQGRAGKAVDHERRRFPTLTAAAKSIVGHAVNGWAVWKTADGRPLKKPAVAERYRRKRTS